MQSGYNSESHLIRNNKKNENCGAVDLLLPTKRLSIIQSTYFLFHFWVLCQYAKQRFVTFGSETNIKSVTFNVIHTYGIGLKLRVLRYARFVHTLKFNYGSGAKRAFKRLILP